MLNTTFPFQSVLQFLKNEIQFNCSLCTDEFYDLNSNEWDIHVITSALKLFFRELPEPLFPFDKFDQFLNAFGT